MRGDSPSRDKNCSRWQEALENRPYRGFDFTDLNAEAYKHAQNDGGDEKLERSQNVKLSFRPVEEKDQESIEHG
jgi:hypothetical protein